MNAFVSRPGAPIAASGSVVFDPTPFPLVVLTFLNEECTEDDLEVIFAGFQELWKRRSRYVLVIDGRRVTKVPTARWRQKLADWERANAGDTQRWNGGAAVVIPNSLVRGALIAVEWLFKPATPRAYFKDVASSREWVLEQLRVHGLPSGPAIEAFFAAEAGTAS